jgi:hypothetical protein
MDGETAGHRGHWGEVSPSTQSMLIAIVCSVPSQIAVDDAPAARDDALRFTESARRGELAESLRCFQTFPGPTGSLRLGGVKFKLKAS